MVQGDYVELVDLGYVVWYVDDFVFYFVVWFVGYEGGIYCMFFGGEQVVVQVYFLGGVGQCQGCDVVFGGYYFVVVDVVGVDVEDFFGFWIDVDFVLVEDVIGWLVVGEFVVSVDVVVGVVDDLFGVVGDDVWCIGEGFFVIDDVVGQQEVVDFVQWDGWDGFGDWCVVDFW